LTSQNKTKNIKRINLNVIMVGKKEVYFLIFLFAFILTFGGCAPQQQQQTGLSIEFMSGAGYITNGKTILEKEPFRIGLKIVNYDEKEKRGMICVYDDQNDYYGGISKDCKEFYVGKAVKNKENIPYTTQTFFPEQGYYNYINLPFDISPEIFIETIYNQDTMLTTLLTYPTPERESFSVSDEFITLNIEKSIHKAESGHEIYLSINLRKNKEVNISYNQQNTLFFSIEARPLAFTCNTPLKQFGNSGIIDLEKENFIRCNALTLTESYEAIPSQINLKYQAIEKNKIRFNVKKK